MAYPREESAKFAQAASEVMGKYEDAKDKLLVADATRGFAAPSGDTLSDLLAVGQEAKGKLTEINGKIYEERRGILFQQEEFAMKVLVQVAKLAMELYRDELMNALAIEQAEAAALRDTGRADVERMNAEVDTRQVAIIRDRAEVERRITILKNALVAAETTTLGSERALINAQLATAEKKLEIIDSIYQVLAAEQLVLAAENRRAATLEVLLEAQLVVAGIKKEMVPFYVEKAKAREALAGAIKAEIPIKEAIEKLGYDRIELEDTKQAADHTTREAEEEVEMARLAWTRANKATEFARMQSRRLLQEYANRIRAEILEKKKTLDMDGIEFKLSTSLARQAIGVNNDVAVTDHEIANLTAELISILVNMQNRATDEAAKIIASSDTLSTSTVVATSYRRITEG
jgi:hypothetical protein